MTTRHWRVLAIAVLAGGLLGGAPAAVAGAQDGRHYPPATGPAEPVLTWNAHAERATSAGRPPASTFVLLGITHVAIYDTVVALGLPARPYLTRHRAPRGTSAAAAVATAAYDVLAARVPAQRSFLDPTYADYLATIPAGPAKQQGVALGRRVARQVLAWRAADGLDNTVTVGWTPPGGVSWHPPPPGPGVWEPTAPTAPVDLVLIQVRPLALRAAGQFTPAGPPALISRRYAEDLEEVKRLGRIDSTARMPHQTETALFWADQTAVQWNRALRLIAADRRLGLGQAARLLTMSLVSAADGAIACWHAKFTFAAWRPVHAIQRAHTDGNPATVAEPTWQPLLGANHPEYTSGHACVSTAVTTALRAFFHRDHVTFTVQSTTTGTTRTYGAFSAALADVTEARILAGLHFRFSMRDGTLVGQRVADHVLHRHFRA